MVSTPPPASTVVATSSGACAVPAAVDVASSSGSGGMANAPPRPVTSLAPGLRFHPTDEELVAYYLKRKICGKSFRFDIITSVEIYKNEPWELASKTKIKTRDQEWFFFSALDRKYPLGGRMSRATAKGYWKTTGLDRVIKHSKRDVGMKKTLVYHYGRSPGGQRTNWVMHEYRLTEAELDKCGASKDPSVLCRMFYKTNLGPAIGHPYGAFIEEEWDDEDTVVPETLVGDVTAIAAKATQAEQHVQSSEAAAVPDSNIPPKTSFLPDLGNSERLDSPPLPDNLDKTPPILQHKRKASDLALNSKGGPCSSSSTPKETTQETGQPVRLSALAEYSLMEYMKTKESSPATRTADSSVPNSSLPPEYIRFTNCLQEQIFKASMDRETLRDELLSIRPIVHTLQFQIDRLTKENEELKMKIQDK